MVGSSSSASTLPPNPKLLWSLGGRSNLLHSLSSSQKETRNQFGFGLASSKRVFRKHKKDMFFFCFGTGRPRTRRSRGGRSSGGGPKSNLFGLLLGSSRGPWEAPRGSGPPKMPRVASLGHVLPLWVSTSPERTRPPTEKKQWKMRNCKTEKQRQKWKT